MLFGKNRIARSLEAFQARDAELGQLAENTADLYREQLDHVAKPYVFFEPSPFENFYASFIYVDPHINAQSESHSATVLEIGNFLVFIPRHCVISSTLSEQIEQVGDADFAYGDSFHFDPQDSSQFTHQLRPGWSPERLRGHCYVGDVVIASEKLVSKAGGREFLSTLSSHDRALRLTEKAQHPKHLEILLYGTSIESRMPDVDLVAVQSHCARLRIKADARLNSNGAAVQVMRRRKKAPSVCAIMPTRGTSADLFGERVVLAAHAIETLRQKSTYSRIELIVVADNETPAESMEAIKKAADGDVVILPYDKPFNFAEKTNLAALETTAEFLLFINDDTEIITPEIIEIMLSYFEDPTVGLVGSMLKYEDGTIQSAGHLMNPYPVDLYRGHDFNGDEAFGILNVAREVSSVIAAFALTPRKVFEKAGGMSMLFPSDYNDVDYAFKLDLLGYKTLFTPHAECFHFESKTRTPGEKPESVALLGKRWQHRIEEDRYSNKYLQPSLPIWKSNHDSEWSMRDAMGTDTVKP